MVGYFRDVCVIRQQYALEPTRLSDSGITVLVGDNKFDVVVTLLNRNEVGTLSI